MVRFQRIFIGNASLDLLFSNSTNRTVKNYCFDRKILYCIICIGKRTSVYSITLYACDQYCLKTAVNAIF